VCYQQFDDMNDECVSKSTGCYLGVDSEHDVDTIDLYNYMDIMDIW
jgi:hypothetical protein